MNLSEEDLRNIALNVISELGDKADPETVKNVISETINSKEINGYEKIVSKSAGRVILTSFGMNHPGIITGVTKALSDANCDITDLSQKLMGEFYTMIIIIDISNSSKELADLQNELNEIADRLKIKVFLQHEDLFRQMHRV